MRVTHCSSRRSTSKHSINTRRPSRSGTTPRFASTWCVVKSNSGRNLETYENLDRSLKYGAAPLEATVYEEALAYQKLLATQIGDIKVRCAPQGVTLTLDVSRSRRARRKRRVACSRVRTRSWARSRASDPRHSSSSWSAAKIKVSRSSSSRSRRAQRSSIAGRATFHGPSSVAASPAVRPARSFSCSPQQFSLVRRSDRRELTDQCTPEERAPFEHYREEGERYNTIGGVLVGVGATAVATGAVMVFLNRGRTVYPEVAPAPGGGGTVSLSGRW